VLRERERRPFESINDLAHRVTELHKDELVTLADIGALNSLGGSSYSRDEERRRQSQELSFHRRDDRPWPPIAQELASDGWT
jgi:hypothetical protein